ncbi:Sucrose synthase 5, partial [Sarracenia purpurea var. burkii]
MNILLEILQAPDPIKTKSFFRRLPTIFKIVIFSVHGYFGQSDVLGLPDTGGQVVYILDQVKALEEELLLRINQQGLSVKPQILVVTRLIPDAQGTKCNQDTVNLEQDTVRELDFPQTWASVVAKNGNYRPNTGGSRLNHRRPHSFF